MKILDFLKEYKFGAAIGGIYFITGFLLFLLGILGRGELVDVLGLIYLPGLYIFYIISRAFQIFPINQQLTIIYIILSVILTLFVIIFIGAGIQKIFKIKATKLNIFLGIGLFIIVFFSFIWISTPESGGLTSRCTFEPEVQCIDYRISATGSSFRIRLKNGVDEAINVQSITLSTESTTPYISTTPPTNPTNWQSGSIIDLTWTGCTGGGLVAGTKGKVLVTIKYYPVAAGPSATKEVKGEVVLTVI